MLFLQVLIRIFSRLSCEQRPYRRHQVMLLHQGLPDQHRIHSRRCQAHDLLVGTDAAFADYRNARRDQGQQVERGVQIGLEALQVAVVDSHQACPAAGARIASEAVCTSTRAQRPRSLASPR